MMEDNDRTAAKEEYDRGTMEYDEPVLLFLPDEIPAGELIRDGRYCQIWKKDSGNLFLRATEEAHEEGIEYFARFAGPDGWGDLWELLEDLICNSDWELISADETGDLASAPILAEGVVRDEEGDFVSCGDLWAFMDYQIKDPLETIFTPGAIWVKA